AAGPPNLRGGGRAVSGTTRTTPDAPAPEDAMRAPLARRVASSSLFLGLVSLVCAAVLWQLAVTIFPIKSYLLPSPVAIGTAMVIQFPYQAQHAVVTLREVLVGFGLAVLIGIPTAVAITFVPVVEKLFYPILVATQAVPKVAVAVVIAVFPVIVDTAVGLRAIDPDMVRLARSMQAGPFKTFWKVRLPVALPNIFAGLKMAMTFSVIGAVVGEFVAGTSGLGYLIQAATGTLQTTVAFASVVLLSFMGIVLFLIVEAFERIFVSWHPSMDRLY